MTPTDYTRLQQDYRQACDLIAEQKKQIETLRGALEPFAQWDIDRIPYGCGFAKHYKVAREALALGSTPPAGSTPVRQGPREEDDGA